MKQKQSAESTYWQLPIPQEGVAKALCKKWTILAWLSLVLAGVYSILLGFSRTPGIQDIIPFIDFFHTSLIVHVNLSVLVWMLSISSLLWTLTYSEGFTLFRQTAFWVVAVGMGLMAISPFTADAYPLLNNYVPILQNKTFLIGLAVFASGMVIQLGVSLVNLASVQRDHPLHIGTASAVVTTLIALVCFGLAYQALSAPEYFIQCLPWEHCPPPIDRDYIPFNREDYYELLFWGGGHILQFTYTHMMLVVWLMLAAITLNKFTLSRNAVIAAFIISTLLVLPTPLIYWKYAITDFGYINAFTQHMKGGGGVASILVGLFLLPYLAKIWRSQTHKVQRNALLMSILLFGVGGFLGFAIRGSNTIIPAHYHGSIVGITIAFMGFIFYILPKLGYGPIEGRWARAQPIIYGTGQLLHIIGLAWSGGYGAQRKTPGAVDNIGAQMGMGLMGFGHLLLMIGGLLFVILAFRSIIKK